MTKKYVKITKVDPDARLVEGYASTEALDSQGERVTRAAIEGALADYMRFGNIREMHQPSAVGKTQVAEMDERGLKISVKVVDDAAWLKVKEGVYNGFSIGGNATIKNGNVIEALDLTEISLVDRPANPEALITLFKAENSTMAKKITKSDVGNALQTIARANLQKACGLSNVSQLASTLESLSWVTADAEWEKQYEGDDSQVPAMLREGYKLLAEALKVMAAEETSEVAAEQAAQAGETEAVERAAKAKLKKAETEETEEESAEGGEEGNDAPTDTNETSTEEGEEETEEEEKPAAPAREYSDEDKLALRAVYRMMKESGVLDDLATEEAAKAEAEKPADEEAEKAKKSEDGEEETEKSDEEEDTTKADGEDNEEEKSEETTEEEEAAKAKKAEGAEEGEEDTAEKMAKGLGLGGKSDTAILKAAGFSSAQEAVNAIVKLNQVVEQMKKLPAMTKGVLRTVDRNGNVQEVSPADMIAKGEKPADVLAKILAGEVDTGPVAKYATPKPPAF